MKPFFFFYIFLEILLLEKFNRLSLLFSLLWNLIHPFCTDEQSLFWTSYITRFMLANSHYLGLVISHVLSWRTGIILDLLYHTFCVGEQALFWTCYITRFVLANRHYLRLKHIRFVFAKSYLFRTSFIIPIQVESFFNATSDS